MNNIFEMTATGGSDWPDGATPAPARKTGKRITRGTDQQGALWTCLRDGAGHVVVEARAGSGKSSSSREGMWRMLERDSRRRIRYAVYNKTMADEFRADCPPLVDVGTCHAFGYESLRRAFGSRCEKLKTYLILDELREGVGMPRYLRRAVALLVTQSKNQYATAEPTDAQLSELLLHFDINPLGKEDLVVGTARKVLRKAAEWTEVVDFDDMIWLPVVRGATFPECDDLFLDEVQDWNPIQHKLIPLICPSGRVIGVGDRWQAIYAWRGADVDSIPNLERLLADRSAGPPHRFPLTITFRCPKSHVALARRYVPDLEAHESNGDGEVEYGVTFDQMLNRVQPGERVIGPANAPIIRAALRLVAERKRAFVRGRAIGDQLAAIVRSCERNAKTVSDLSREVERWRGRELMRLADRDGVEDLAESVNDRADGLQAVLVCCAAPADAYQAIQELFSEADQANAVNLSTIHRAKGLESDTVWFVDQPQRQPTRDWEEQQQRNVRYVALTRSKNKLAFVSPDK